MRNSKKVIIYEAVVEKANKVGNSCHILLPKSWLNKKVMAIKMERGKINEIKKNDMVS